MPKGYPYRVATRPFATNYKIPIAQGFIVLNGDQITKIEAIQQRDALGSPEDKWTLIFFLSDGNQQQIAASDWTRNFVRDVFEIDV